MDRLASLCQSACVCSACVCGIRDFARILPSPHCM